MSTNKLSSEMSTRTITYREALFESMDGIMSGNPNAIVMGQGVDDHKGIFGTTTDFNKKYGAQRCFDTPLAEEGMTGVGLGAALAGLYPIQTHIRADFALLAMNQVINLAAKYKYMFGGLFEVPMLIRLVVGRSWGQGAQHSQSLQSLFSHIPGLSVIMPYRPSRILQDYRYAAEHIKGPVIAIEHRLMYELAFEEEPAELEKSIDGLGSHLVREGSDVTIVATSIMVLEAERAAAHLKEVAGIDCEIIDLNCTSHPDWELVLKSVAKTKRLVIADTSWKAFGVCSEVCRIVLESGVSLDAPAKTVGMQPSPCPTAKSLEDLYYPNLGDLCEVIAKVVTGSDSHGIELPSEKSMADVYKRFRGPF